MLAAKGADFLSTMDRFLARFQEQHQNISVTAVRIVLAVGQADFSEGDTDNLWTVTDLADELHIPQPTVSRLLRVLGEGDDRLGPEGGLRLVETFRDPFHHRVKRIKLTDEGEALLHGATFVAHADD